MKKGWEITLLKDACKVFADGDWIESKDQSSDGIRLVQTGNIGFGYFKDKEDKSRYISEETFFRLKCTEILPGDLLVSRLPDPVGKSCIIPEINSKMITGVDCTIIRPNENLSSEFLCYYQMSNQYLNDVQSGVSGATRQRISRKNLGLIEIPIPPLTEQKSIVAILDEAFAAIAKAKANAEQNLKNAKELFESYLQGVFENKGEDWEEKEFGDIITTLTDYHANGSYEILKKNVELKDTEDYAWMVRSTDFEKDFENDFRYTDEKGYNFLSKSKVLGGEIIMSKIGNAGNVYLMPKVQRPCSLAMNLFLIRLDEKKAIPEYVFHYLKSKKGDIQIKSRLLGMATKTITKDNVRNIIIPFPTLQEQQNIVQKLDTLSTETKKLEAIYQQKINDLEELKKSVLQKTFSGELKIVKALV